MAPMGFYYLSSSRFIMLYMKNMGLGCGELMWSALCTRGASGVLES